MSNKPVKKINELDFIRAFCALGIIGYHLSSHTAPVAPKILYECANGSLGPIFVEVFLMISGGVLYHNYSNIASLRQFYFKRWKSIFPMFYLVWSFRFIDLVLNSGFSFTSNNPYTLLFTILGVDGYFLYKFPTYYLVGEWFLGAIIMLYILYPLFLILVNRFGWKLLIFSLPIWIWQVETNIFVISSTRNLIYCSCIFLLGMLIFKYKLYDKKELQIAALFICSFLLTVHFNILRRYIRIIISFFGFILLFCTGSLVMKSSKLNSIFSLLSRLSYPLFLVHHFIVVGLVNFFQPTTMHSVLFVYILSIFISTIYAWCCDIIFHTLTKTAWFMRIENHFLHQKVIKE